MTKTNHGNLIENPFKLSKIKILISSINNRIYLVVQHKSKIIIKKVIVIVNIKHVYRESWYNMKKC